MIDASGDPERGTNAAARPAEPAPASTKPAYEEAIRLGDSTMTLAALRARPEMFVRLYVRAKATVGHAECLCTTPPQRLVIRTRAGRHHLACWPGQRGRHAQHCHFHQ